MCFLTTGFNPAASNCDDLFSIGGLQTLYLANFAEVSTVTDSDTDNVYDTITMSASGEMFYKFAINKDSGSFESPLQIGGSNNKYFAQTLTFSFAGQDAEAIKTFKNLAGGKFMAVAVNRAGKKFLLGRVTPLEAIDGTTFLSGAAEADASAMTVVLSGATITPAEAFLGNPSLTAGSGLFKVDAV